MKLAAASAGTCLRPAANLQRPRWAAAGGASRPRPSPRRAWSAVTAARQQQPEESSGSGGGFNSGGSWRQQPRGAGGRFMSHTDEPQPQLQAWLQQQQGVPAAKADQYARRLARVFGSQQAALDGLPATFEWCRSQGLTGLQTAVVLGRIASHRWDSVVQFAATAQDDWQLIDSYIAACVQAAGGSKRLTHTSLAEKLGSSLDYAESLGMPPGHVEAWLAAVSERLPAPSIGRLLLSNPAVVTGAPATALAAIDWAAEELGPADPVAFFAAAATLLKSAVATLQRKFDSLQQALGSTAEQARQLAVKMPVLLSTGADTVADAMRWLRQHFAAPEQLADVISRGPRLLCQSAERLQTNADALQRALGWQDGNGQLAAFIAAYPQGFATVDFGSKETEAKLRLLTQVVGADPGDCMKKGSSYLKSGLDSMCAHYMLALERAPQMLRDRAGGIGLQWIVTVSDAKYRSRLGITTEELHAFVGDWPRSKEGRRLLEGLRAGSVEGWPRPPLLDEGEQRAEAEQRRQARAARRTGKAAGVADKRQGRRRGQTQAGGGAGGDAAAEDVAAL